MAERRTKQSRPPALTPEAAERRCIDAAYKLAQQQLDEGTASPSVIAHFLKMGTARAQLEQEKLRKETELLQTKKIAIEETQHMEQMFGEAIAAMKRYQGYSEEEEDDEDWD